MWYHYCQNNSYGRWNLDTGKVVWIEADTPEEADSIAETVGIYFDGCKADIDCPCCGDRWTRQTVWTDDFPDVEAMMRYSDRFEARHYPYVFFYPKED